jgi:Rod binding domain-containing protein
MNDFSPAPVALKSLSVEDLTKPNAKPSQANDPSDNTPAARKLRKSAQEFEGMLISSLWQEIQKGMQEDQGGALNSGADTMQNMGINSAAMALASKGGGIGIARMIYGSLKPALTKVEDQQKVNK